MRRRSKTGRSPINVQFATARRGVPHARALRAWAQTALRHTGSSRSIGLTLRVVGAAESRRLNRTWRDKDKPTNVLSFAYSDSPASGQLPVASSLPLGDLVLCAPVIAREARAQRKPPQAHWAHMIAHGVLHLLGYDHVKSRDAKIMESFEVEILARLGYQDPYVVQ